jgi:hypothetical protein
VAFLVNETGEPLDYYVPDVKWWDWLMLIEGRNML